MSRRFASEKFIKNFRCPRDVEQIPRMDERKYLEGTLH